MKKIGATWLLVLLVGLLGCGRRSTAPETTSSDDQTTSGDQAATATDATPEALDARYREASAHLSANPVWDGPMSSMAGDALTVLRAYSDGRSNPETYMTLEIVSPDWVISRNRATGIVVDRHVNAMSIARFPDGRCLLYAASFLQEAIGEDFSNNLITRGTGGGYPVPCETVNAIAAARSSVAQ